MTPDALHQQALDRYKRGRFDEAAALFAQAADGYRAANNLTLQAEMLSNGGVALRALGQFALARQRIESALAILRQSGDRRREALALGNLGAVLLAEGDLPSAATALNQSLDLLDPTSDAQERSEVLRLLGEVRLKQGKYLAGLIDYEAGLRDVRHSTAQQAWLRKLLAVPLRMLGRK